MMKRRKKMKEGDEEMRKNISSRWYTERYDGLHDPKVTFLIKKRSND
jgi:hypothetical protein